MPKTYTAFLIAVFGLLATTIALAAVLELEAPVKALIFQGPPKDQSRL
jgi:hypothetical protein